MASAPSQQGQDEAQRRQAALAVGGGVAAAAAAGAPAYAGVQVAQAIPAIPAKAARVAALSAITAALVMFLTRQRQQTRQWLERQLPAVARGLAPNDVQQVITDEELRDQAFAEKQAERMTSDLTAALAIPDPRDRELRVQAILRREERFARMRSEAMAARAFAAVDRLVLRTESPQGAYWKSDPHVKEHTAGCLIMSGGGRGRGRFWPWAVLDRVHPPRHPGCPCRLHSYGEALKQGWLGAGDVLNVRDAISQAAGVVMEFDAEAAEGLNRELRLLELREVLVERELTTPEQFDRLLPLARR